jgi:DNA-binding LacI/PurR family transcriptional regulator
MNKQPTLRDVAALASVDPSVVSRVVSSDPRLAITAETRQRVEKAIAELQYRPNVQARGLRLRRTWTVGFVVPDIGNPVYAQIVNGAQVRAEEAGYALAVGSPLDGKSVDRAFARLLRGHRFDGLLVASSRLEDSRMVALNKSGAPVVVVNRRVTGIDSSVVLDDAAGAETATAHLIKRGHTAIAHIGGPSGIDTSVRRRSGFTAAMDARGLKNYQVVTAVDYPAPAGYEAMNQLLAGRRRFTAVFVASVMLAIGAMRAVRDAGLRVPEDISIASLQDVPLAEYIEPPLTTVAMPLQELGAAAVEMMLARIDGQPGESLMLPTTPQLIARASTGPPPP